MDSYMWSFIIGIGAGVVLTLACSVQVGRDFNAAPKPPIQFLKDRLNKGATQAEIDADTYLTWSDKSLADLIRVNAAILKDHYGDKASFSGGAALLLTATMLRGGADHFTSDMEGVTYEGKPLGNWRLTVDLEPLEGEGHK